MAEEALADIKVLEYAHLVSGPFCAKLFADLGAEVIKIEQPRIGDEARRRGPFPQDVPHAERSGLFLYLNTNKLGVTLDPRTEAGKKIFKQLVEKSNILIENNPPAIMEDMGLSYENLQVINRQLVMVSITPFGQTGPYSRFKSYYLNTFHAGGEGYCLPGGLGWELYDYREPIKIGGFVGECNTGVSAAIAALAAFYQTKLGGTGQYIEVSQQEALLGLDRQELNDYNLGIVQSRATRSLPLGGLIQCKDGFVELMPFQEHMWRALLNLMGNPAWASQERFTTWENLIDPYGHQEEQAEANKFIKTWAAEQTKEDLYYKGQEAGVAVGMVCTPEEVFKSKQLRERAFFVQAQHPEAGNLEYPGVPYRLSRTPGKLKKAAPLLGEHNQEIYEKRLGYDVNQLVMLREAGVI